MPRITRSGNTYVALPDNIATKSIDSAKVQVSVTVTVPSSMEGKKLDKFMEEAIDGVGKDFKKFVKNRIEKLEE